ncbi:unnamed protein product [Tuber melanosporum]|uniref:(Perigord truffle) hypothetical protein n=1 Tax=Tuber melanosporum (strain Mel28) TaxID=656061 RepID=D5G845_TUBMM|nr:uncharacterized protein GSTUM_00002808001 [Tuber melanosporum]CAZ80688.1 unnamed protein product [Tuber melanosporum]
MFNSMVRKLEEQLSSQRNTYPKPMLYHGLARKCNKSGKASQNLTRNLPSSSHPLLFSEQRARRHSSLKASTNKPTPQPSLLPPTYDTCTRKSGEWLAKSTNQ